MEYSELIAFVDELAQADQLLGATISDPIWEESPWGEKVVVRPISIKGVRQYQLTCFKDNKAFHRNVSIADCAATMSELLALFKQGQLFTLEADFHIQQKGVALSCKSKPPTHKAPEGSREHNRSKQHLLPEGIADPYLIGLGLMSSSGKVIAAKAHKFRQINRFLELMDQTIGDIPAGRSLHLVDLGCGKAYLTFALYHYLQQIKKVKVTMTGVDRRADVIADCHRLAEKLGYDQLQFLQTDIDSFTPEQQVDVVVSLHACNIATDYALAKAIAWQASYIFAAPCCQHELYDQVESDSLTTLLRHGILKERFAALATDAARAELLAAKGYKTQVIEFVDLEHSPKNLLLRAERDLNPERQQQAWSRYTKLKEALHITPKLETLLA